MGNDYERDDKVLYNDNDKRNNKKQDLYLI